MINTKNYKLATIKLKNEDVYRNVYILDLDNQLIEPDKFVSFYEPVLSNKEINTFYNKVCIPMFNVSEIIYNEQLRIEF